MMIRNYIFCFVLIFLLKTEIIAQVNYDEDKVPNYQLPALLTSENLNDHQNKVIWEESRRQEILTLFEEHVFGSFPISQVRLTHRVDGNFPNAIEGIGDLKNVILNVSNGQQSHEIGLSIFLPSKSKEAVPVFLAYNFYGNHTTHASTQIPITNSFVGNNEKLNISNNKATDASRGVRAHRWPIEDILQRGYGLAIMYYGDVDPDYDDGFKNGLHSLLQLPMDKMPSSIETWATGLSFAIDYLSNDERINKKQVAVLGHSRLGKAALWAGAKDERIAMVISNNSGCGGAALSRRKFGETVAIINKQFPHWFNSKFKTYSGNEGEMPIDQHMLLALSAPRPLYVASASEDLWADPKGERLSLIHAGDIYKLYGQEVLDQKMKVEADSALIKGKTGYHIRTGKHDLTSFDWEKYMDFADLQFNK